MRFLPNVVVTLWLRANVDTEISKTKIRKTLPTGLIYGGEERKANGVELLVGGFGLAAQ